MIFENGAKKKGRQTNSQICTLPGKETVGFCLKMIAVANKISWSNKFKTHS